MARRYKVSTLVVLRRIFDIGALERGALASAYRREVKRLGTAPARSGGSFRPTLKACVGQRFGQAVVTSTLGGRTSFSESFRLLGIRKASTFRDFAARAGNMDVRRYRKAFLHANEGEALRRKVSGP